MRRKLTAHTALKILRIAAMERQQSIGRKIGADQSTVSRAENGGMYLTDEFVRRYIDACGGSRTIQTLIDLLQRFLDRQNYLPLLPA